MQNITSAAQKFSNTICHPILAEKWANLEYIPEGLIIGFHNCDLAFERLWEMFKSNSADMCAR
jgi:hypothetical protein